MAVNDYEYPGIKNTDYIDESLPNILARDDASKHGFRRVNTFPAVTEDDIGMKVYKVGDGNYQLISVSPDPYWKPLNKDGREPAYSDWVIDNYQPLSSVLTSLSGFTNTSSAMPYFDGPSEFKTLALSSYVKGMTNVASAANMRTYLGLGTISTLNTPISGSYIADGTVTTNKISTSFKQEMGWTTGDVKLTFKTTADTGWIMVNDGSISKTGYYTSTGSKVSGYSGPEFEALFKLMWSISACTVLSSAGVATSKGASAAADWNDSKRLVLPKILGRALASAGAGSGLTSRARGASVGNETVALTIAQLPAHTHTMTLKTTHGRDANTPDDARFCNGDSWSNTTRTGTTSSVGSGNAHNNMQPTVFLNVMIKL